MKSAEWYFDFISPFSYLQIEAFDRLPDLKLTLRPVLFAGLLNHWGHKGPAEIPEKRRFTYRFVQWLAERQGVPMKFPPVHPFNPIKALRLAIVAGNDIASVQAIFRHIWREGKSIDDRWVGANFARGSELLIQIRGSMNRKSRKNSNATARGLWPPACLACRHSLSAASCFGAPMPLT